MQNLMENLWDPYAEFEHRSLPNALSTYTSQWAGRAWQAFSFLVHTGSECDPVGKEGTAHFVEHMVNENALLPHKDMEAFFEECGGSADFGATSFSATSYGFFLPADPKLIARGLELLGSMLMSAKMEKGLEQERNIIVGEFQRRFPIPALSWDLGARHRKMHYAGTRLERLISPLGPLACIQAMDAETLQSFHDEHYTPANISIVSAGGLSTEVISRLIAESIFGQGKPGKRNPVPERFAPGKPEEPEYRFDMKPHTRGLTNVAYSSSIAGVVPARSIAVAITNELLSNLLTEEVREKRGWTYHIGCQQSYWRSCYDFAIECRSLAPAGLDSIDAVVDTCIKEARGREDLFKRIRSRRLYAKALRDPTGRSVVNNVAGDLDRYQYVRTARDEINELEAVTFADVADVLDKLHRENRWTLLQIP